MLDLVLISIALTLAGLTGMQFFYMLVLERRDAEQKKRIHELEQRCIYLASRVDETEVRLAEQDEFIESLYEEMDSDDEDDADHVWADIIDEH